MLIDSFCLILGCVKRFVIFGLCLALLGCQKKEAKNLPRCIYDQPAFSQCAAAFIADDVQFAQFKRNPFFNLLWENLSKEEGEMWLGKVESEHPEILAYLEALRESDFVGSPRVFDYGRVGSFSPSTLRLAVIGAEIRSRVGSLKEKKVVQIGAGYGGLCRVLHVFEKVGSYTIVDLEEQLQLAKKYLEAFGLHEVTYLTPDQLLTKQEYDLVVSDGSFSEFARADQEVFFERILTKSSSGYLLGHVFPKHYGVVPLSTQEIQARFVGKGSYARWEFHEPKVDNENYFVFWKEE